MEITLAQRSQANDIFSILRSCKQDLDGQGIFQWTENYPVLSLVENDIAKGHLYCAVDKGRCLGVVSVNDEQEAEYAAIPWNCNTGRALVIHRLAVDPVCQGRGIARGLMDFAEQYGTGNNYNTVRLDAFSANKRVLQFYEARGYIKRGEVFFPGRQQPFFCYEKDLSCCL